MNCAEFRQHTERWMEGEREREAREHALACERCRALVEDLDAIRLAAPLMAEAVAPPERLWVAVRTQLEREGLIRRPSWADRLVRWTRVAAHPVAATTAATVLAAALVVLSLGLRTRPQPSSPGRQWLSSDQPELVKVDTQLDHLERKTIRSFHTPDPAVKEALQENLMIIDRQIARCEKTLEQAPSDQNTRDYLYDAYRQKAQLLNMMAERSTAAAEE